MTILLNILCFVGALLLVFCILVLIALSFAGVDIYKAWKRDRELTAKRLARPDMAQNTDD